MQRDIENCMPDIEWNTWMTIILDVIEKVKILNCQWVDQVAKRIDERWTKVLEWYLRGCKKVHGRWVGEILKNVYIS